MEVIHARRAECDSEGEEADVIRDEFIAKLKWLGYDPERDDVFMPSKIATKILNAATGDRSTTTAASRILKQLHKEGRLHELKPSHRANDSSRSRGFRWVGVHCPDSTPTYYDIGARFKELSLSENGGNTSSDQVF